MVDFNPREGERYVEDALQHENRRLKEALHLLFTKISEGGALIDIQILAAKLSAIIEWPDAGLYGKEEEE